jgi:hypothetical protein
VKTLFERTDYFIAVTRLFFQVMEKDVFEFPSLKRSSVPVHVRRRGNVFEIVFLKLVFDGSSSDGNR